MSSSEVLDFEKICRLCLSEKRSMSAIFSKKKSDCKVPLSVRIMSCGALQLYEGDGLPASICSKCLANVNQSYAFREQCEQADNTLRQYLQRKNEIADEEEPKIEAELQLETEPEPEMDLETENEPEASTSDGSNSEEEDNPTDKKRKRKKVMPLKHTCGVCEVKFSSKSELRNHGVVHQYDKVLTCPYCSKVFRRSGSYEKHLKIHFDNNVNLSKRKEKSNNSCCDICGVKCEADEQFLEHIKKHINENNQYFCDLCLKTYKRVEDLKKHRLTHFTTPQYLCSTCGKKYYSVSKLNEHRGYCLNERKHACQHCSRKFNVRSQLRRHLNIHEAEKYIKCDLCDKSFSRHDNFRQHYRLHTGETPFTCDICGKGFRLKGSMLYHKQKHSLQRYCPVTELVDIKPVT